MCATDALEAFDEMQPHALAWLRAMCGASTLSDFVAWCAVRVERAVRGKVSIVFVEPQHGDDVRVHPFLRPEARLDAAAVQADALEVLRETGAKRLVVCVKANASRRVRALVAQCGFEFAGAHASAPDAVADEMWTFDAMKERENG